MTLKTAAVGNEIFLQGSYLSVGLSASGTIGTRQAAPTGLQTDKASGYMRAGLYADLDGFGTGETTTLRDAVLPGSSVEGFTLGYKLGGAVQTETNYDLLGVRDIVGTSSYSATKDVATALWQGATKDKLEVSQTATLVDSGKYVRFDVMLTNKSAESMSDVRYMRSMDTDQGSSYATLNRIVDQGNGKALVSSAATDGTSPAFLYANDARAVASIFGYKNFDPYTALAYNKPQAEGTSISADMTINLTFDLGTLAAGKSTTLSFYVGVTNDLTKTISQIDTSDLPLPAKPATNVAPNAIDDVFVAAYNTAVKGSVLANDKDPDGNALTATVVTGPANGTLTLNKDGTFIYTAKSGFSGTDSFVYAASDGTLSDRATATVKIAGPAVLTVLDRAHSNDLSAATNQFVTGKADHESFFVDVTAVSGKDTITSFESNDVLLTTKALFDGNNDGIIAFSTGTTLAVDGANSKDAIIFNGDTDSLRFLGQTKAGLFVYADEDVRPFKAVEGKLSDDVLSGSNNAAKATTFFFDTALDVNLGSDKIVKFGTKDLLVTTTEMASVDGMIKVDASGSFALPGGVGGRDDMYIPGEGGHVAVTDFGGRAITELEYDGVASHNGTQYFVYSQVGSTVGTHDLLF
jgi:VCBS repeat-containing protein